MTFREFLLSFNRAVPNRRIEVITGEKEGVGEMTQLGYFRCFDTAEEFILSATCLEDCEFRHKENCIHESTRVRNRWYVTIRMRQLAKAGDPARDLAI